MTLLLTKPWTPLRALLALCASALLIALAHWADPWFYAHFVDRSSLNPFDRLPDWRQSLRIFGYAPLWAVVAFVYWRESARPSQEKTRAALGLALLPFASVLLVELIKLIVRRRRPIDAAGLYEFVPYSGSLSTSGLGFPSGHAAVAMTGAFLLARLCPRTGWLWILLSVGGSLSRVVQRHHFFSDVVTSAILAFLLCTLFQRSLLSRKEHL